MSIHRLSLARMVPVLTLACAVGAASSSGCSPSSGTDAAATGGASSGGSTSSGGSGGTRSAGGVTAAGGTTSTGGISFGGFGAYTGNDSGTAGRGAGGDCGSVTIDTSVEEVVTPGNVLVIFDQSESMNTADFNGQVRWLAASDALVNALAPNRDVLNIGAVLFPSKRGTLRGDCDINSVCTIDDTACTNPQIPFQKGTPFIDAWAAHWQTSPLTIGTPIDVGMMRGDDALTKAQLTGTTVVIFVTDGEPTCNLGANTTSTLPAKWLSAGIKTYVVGLPGAGASTLQTIATAGGTQNYFTPSDSAELESELAKITSTIVKRSFNGCEIKFNDTPPDPAKVVLVVVDQNGQKFSVSPGPDGFELASDTSKATLKGATCSDALSGRFASISFAFGCVDAPPLR
jgi:hypothetical protein